MSELIEKDRSIKEALDELELQMREHPQVDCPLIHRFTPGMYIREIYMPKGTLIISKVHKTEHPFVVSAGVVLVKDNEGEWEMFEAPYSGVTKPGTRRVLFIEEDTVWTTFHVNADDCHDPLEIEERIIEKSDNELLQPMENVSSQLIVLQ